jgi:hypothetical protein
MSLRSIRPALRAIFRTIAIAAALAVALGGLAACSEARSTARPSASLLDVEFTPQPTRSASVTPSPEPTEKPTFISLPIGWDDAFCAVVSGAIISQELIIDIERALTEENFRDARGLARDLRDTATEATVLVTELTPWDPAADVTAQLAALIDLDSRAGVEYGTYFTDASRNALRRARALRRDVFDATPLANEALADMAALGITCGDLPLRLELPAAGARVVRTSDA